MMFITFDTGNLGIISFGLTSKFCAVIAMN